MKLEFHGSRITSDDISALADHSGQWIDRVHGRRPPRDIVLDMDSSVGTTHGDQEMSVWNGYYACTCYRPPFLFNQFDDLERNELRPGNVHSPDAAPRGEGPSLPIPSFGSNLSSPHQAGHRVDVG